MKTLLSSLLAILVLVTTALAADKPRDIVTSDGTTYHNATIISRDAHQAILACDEGTVVVPLDNLPADVQKELGYLGREAEAKAAADKAAQLKAQAEQAEKDKLAKAESVKHEILPGTEKQAYPELNPDFFPDELASQISLYNGKAQYTSLLSEGGHTSATIKANAATLAALHKIYKDYKALMQNPPADLDVAKTRKAVADGDYHPFAGMPEIVVQAIMGLPDSVDTTTSPDKTSTYKVYHYADSRFVFQNGKYIDAANPPTK